MFRHGRQQQQTGDQSWVLKRLPLATNQMPVEIRLLTLESAQLVSSRGKFSLARRPNCSLTPMSSHQNGARTGSTAVLATGRENHGPCFQICPERAGAGALIAPGHRVSELAGTRFRVSVFAISPDRAPATRFFVRSVSATCLLPPNN